MGYVQRIIAACLLVMATGVQAAEETGASLRETEARGLGSVSEERLGTFLRNPRSRHEALKMSRAWIDQQPRATGGDEWRCLSEALYFEARGETIKGQFAVAEVIMNRVDSTRFPDNICGVVNEGTGRKFQCQFTYTCDGHAERINEPRAYERVAKVARAALDGRAPEITGGATHYHTTAVSPRWSRIYTKTARIGVHIFYRHTYRTASN